MAEQSGSGLTWIYFFYNMVEETVWQDSNLIIFSLQWGEKQVLIKFL